MLSFFYFDFLLPSGLPLRLLGIHSFLSHPDGSERVLRNQRTGETGVLESQSHLAFAASASRNHLVLSLKHSLQGVTFPGSSLPSIIDQLWIRTLTQPGG